MLGRLPSALRPKADSSKQLFPSATLGQQIRFIAQNDSSLSSERSSCSVVASRTIAFQGTGVRRCSEHVFSFLSFSEYRRLLSDRHLHPTRRHYKLC